MKLAIDLGPSQMKKLRDEASRLGVPLEELARATVSNLLNVPSDDFERAASKVLEKNKALYERLS